MQTRHHRDGGGWESTAGYARAVRRGPRIEVSGTTVPGRGPDAPEETGRQTREALERALDGVAALGGRIDDVVRTRLYLAPGAVWTEAAAAHGDVLAAVAPANTTLYVGGLIGDALVEVEVEAHCLDADADASDGQGPA